jgi:hypothetical protein
MAAAADWKAFLERLAKEEIDPSTIETEQDLRGLLDDVWKDAGAAAKSRVRTHWKNTIQKGSGGGTGAGSGTPSPAPATPVTPSVSSSSLAHRMFDDSVSASLPLPPANLFDGPSLYVPVPAKECLRGVGLWNHDNVIAWCERFVDEHVDWREQGVTRDQALALVLYTFDMGPGHAQDNIYARVNRALRERKPDEGSSGGTSSGTW